MLSLAEELDASEHYCTRLLEHVLPDAAQSVDEVAMRHAILFQQKEHSAMLASIHLIFGAATNVDASHSQVSAFLQKFMFNVIQVIATGRMGLVLIWHSSLCARSMLQPRKLLNLMLERSVSLPDPRILTVCLNAHLRCG